MIAVIIATAPAMGNNFFIVSSFRFNISAYKTSLLFIKMFAIKEQINVHTILTKIASNNENTFGVVVVNADAPVIVKLNILASAPNPSICSPI